MPHQHPSPLTWSLLAALALPACRVAYLGRAALHQAELMAKREPIERVLAEGNLEPRQAERLEKVAAIKAFGEELGLAPTRNYETISARWDRRITNFSACEPLSLEPVGWWFPVVGSVPYLGFFRDQDVRRWESRYRDRGYDVMVRDVAAYSTLGWFRDPVLPTMLDWEEYRLAEVVLHELAHATLWIPGSVDLNETFANVLGEEAATRWMLSRYGDASPQVQDMWARREDRILWRQLHEGLYSELDALYKNPNVSPQIKLERKAEAFESVEWRVRTAGFHHLEPHLEEVRSGTWNNARVAQYRTYNRDREAFVQLLEQVDGDLQRFVMEIEKITSNQDDPLLSLQMAAGLEAPVQK
jgi:predicted aminopeptidase